MYVGRCLEIDYYRFRTILSLTNRLTQPPLRGLPELSQRMVEKQLFDLLIFMRTKTLKRLKTDSYSVEMYEGGLNWVEHCQNYLHTVGSYSKQLWTIKYL